MNKESFFWNLYAELIYFLIRRSIPYQEMNQKIVKTLDLRNGLKILDAGCGPGYQILAIAKSGYKNLQITGVDFSNNMLKIAKGNCRNISNIELKKADLNQRLNYKDDFFDRIIIINALYTLKNTKLILKDLNRVLKTQGKLVIVDPKPKAQLGKIFSEHLKKAPWDIFVMILVFPLVLIFNLVILASEKKQKYHFYPKEGFESLLREAGFDTIEISSTYAKQDWFVITKK